MRGEHYSTTVTETFNSGSSPHARGTRLHSRFMRCASGIIPACAGNTSRLSSRIRDTWDHPRMRGEHVAESLHCPAPPGSSPHARGTRKCYGVCKASAGIIPACAGNTCRPSNRSSPHWDHPRMRGEHFFRDHELLLAEGSSPHARGTLMFRPFVYLVAGIIPACAGNTASANPVVFSDGDHPRMRGEHLFVRFSCKQRQGSSPHARGTHGEVDLAAQDGGIIPACAGNT